MLASLPTLADRNFILGFFLPALLFMLAVTFHFSDIESVGTVLKLLTEQNIGTAAYLLVMVWLGAVLLLVINHPLYRLLQGYYFAGHFGEWRKSRHRDRLLRDQAEMASLLERAASEGAAFPRNDAKRISALKLELTRRASSNPQEILPTAFGNAIKAFEIYPRDVYGVDGVTVWLRLTAILSKEFAEQVQVARTQIDFLINACFLACLFAVTTLIRATYNMLTGACMLSDWVWPVIGALISCMFYWAAVARVPGWGEMVMAAFDCYLPALAKQLGYELPRKAKERRRFWTALSLTFTYRRDHSGRPLFQPADWIKPPTKPAPPPQPPAPIVQPVIVQVEVNDPRV